MRMRRSSPESGFTLLEVLVAFAVLAVMIVPILQVFGGGLGTTETARAYTTATLLARSKLAEVGVAETLGGRRNDRNFRRTGLSLAAFDCSGHVGSRADGALWRR